MVARDERESVHALVDRYYTGVYRYALSQLRSPQDAEDAAQNTFLRAFVAIQKGVVPENEAAWLFTIAHNVCASAKLAWLRRRRVETPRDLELLPQEPAAPEPPRAELDGLADALAAMPPRLREALLLREWQGLSYAEIADRLDTSRSAVESLIFRARRFLAAELQTLVVGPLAWVRGLLGGGAAARGAGAAAVLAAGVAAAVTVPSGHSPARTGPQRTVRAGDAPIGAVLEAPGAARTRAAATPRGRSAPRQAGDVPTAGAGTATEAPPANASAGATASTAARTATGGAPATATTAVAEPAATLPAATLPAATLPAATLPAATPLTTPTVTTPGVTVTAPTTTLPAPLP